MKSDLEARERELNEMIVARKHAEAFEKFYADDCEMQENSDPPTRGKVAKSRRRKVKAPSAPILSLRLCVLAPLR